MRRKDSTIQMPTMKMTWEAGVAEKPKEMTAAVVVRDQLVVVSRRERQVSERLSSPRYNWAMACFRDGGSLVLVLVPLVTVVGHPVFSPGQHRRVASPARRAHPPGGTMAIPFLHDTPPPVDPVAALLQLLEAEEERVVRLWSKRIHAETYEVAIPGRSLRAPLRRLLDELVRLLRDRGADALRLWPEVVRSHGARRYDQRFEAEDLAREFKALEEVLLHVYARRNGVLEPEVAELHRGAGGRGACLGAGLLRAGAEDGGGALPRGGGDGVACSTTWRWASSWPRWTARCRSPRRR